MTNPEQKHVPVMLEEVLEYLSPKAGGVYLDCTFGGGGHTSSILDVNEQVRVISLDCDPQAQVRAESVKAKYGDRFKLYSINFGQVEEIEEKDFDGILFDLGVSSFQLDEAERGFSFRFEGPLDMRMNPNEGLSASEFLNKATLRELTIAIRDYGEEPKWHNVIEAILRARNTELLEDTAKFAELISNTVEKVRRGKPSRIHPATKTFQGIRIKINRELENLEEALPAAFAKLKVGGMMLVISFHSLEDRIVKRFFRRMAGMPEHANDNKAQDERVKRAELAFNRPLLPSEKEIASNPRSRSAKLRILTKTQPTQR